MRREGFELTVSPPKIITTKCELTGQELEPFEEGKLFGCKLL
jgi:predicted membrane GTPase involved in stress response